MMRSRALTICVVASLALGQPAHCQAEDSKGSNPEFLPPVKLHGVHETREFQPLSADAPVENEYLLGPGDVIEVTDPSIGEPGRPSTVTTTVAPDGTVSIYPVGVLVASGKSVRQLTEEVRQKAQKFVVNPEMVLSLAKTRPVEVYVTGDVLSPGLYQARPGDAAGPKPAPGKGKATSILPVVVPTRGSGKNEPVVLGTQDPSFPERKLQAVTTLTALTAVQLAGGARETADVRHVQVRRKRDKSLVTVDLFDLLVNGNAAQDLRLEDGDIVMVPKGGSGFDSDLLGLAASQSRIVRVFGAVKNPGIYSLGPHDDVISIISRAGGFTPTAWQHKVLLSRVERTGEHKVFKVSIQKSLRESHYIGKMPVMPGDAILVKDSLVKRVAPRALTIASTFTAAFFILLLSRRIVDQSQGGSGTPNFGGSTLNVRSGLNANNAGPLGLPAVF